MTYLLCAGESGVKVFGCVRVKCVCMFVYPCLFVCTSRLLCAYECACCAFFCLFMFMAVCVCSSKCVSKCLCLPPYSSQFHSSHLSCASFLEQVQLWSGSGGGLVQRRRAFGCSTSNALSLSNKGPPATKDFDLQQQRSNLSSQRTTI